MNAPDRQNTRSAEVDRTTSTRLVRFDKMATVKLHSPEQQDHLRRILLSGRDPHVTRPKFRLGPPQSPRVM